MFSNTNTDSSRHNSAASTASSPVTTSATKAQTTFPDQKSIYQNRTPEESARIAVFAAFVSSPVHFEQKYSVKRVIGFGSNGVVLAATQGSTTGVAIKIIYKSKPSFNAPNPPEIDILLQLSKSTSTSSNLLHYIEHWQDAQNHYLVTELHGSDWLASTSPSLTPLSFTIPTTKKSYTFPIASGSSDLWAWSFAHRQHLHNTEGHSYLPLHPVKRIVKQIALALQEMHGNGYYHGDVKIENVLVGSDVSVQLADFGHSRHVSQGIKAYGTAEVSAPEFLSDSGFASGEVDGRSADVFALGMVLFMLLNEGGEVPTMVAEVMKGRVGYGRLVGCNYGEYPLNDVGELDEAGWEILYAMTRVDPTMRVSVDQVLAHPFFADV